MISKCEDPACSVCGSGKAEFERIARAAGLLPERKRARWHVAVFLLGCAAISTGLVLLGAYAARGATVRDLPPQCELVRITEPGAPHALWTQWCGTGANGTSPLEEGVSGHGPLTVDGATLTPSDCTRRHPCVILWPASPPLP